MLMDISFPLTPALCLGERAGVRAGVRGKAACNGSRSARNVEEPL